MQHKASSKAGCWKRVRLTKNFFPWLQNVHRTQAFFARHGSLVKMQFKAAVFFKLFTNHDCITIQFMWAEGRCTWVSRLVLSSHSYKVASLLEPASYSADLVMAESGLIQILYLSVFPGSKSTVAMVSQEQFDNIMCTCLSFMLLFFNFSTWLPMALEFLHLSYFGLQE